MTAFRDRVRHRRDSGPCARLRSRSCGSQDPRPPADTEAAIVRIVAKTYLRSGNQLEAAARMAARLGWAAGRAMQGEST